MPKRRANGEGNIRKRKDGRWEGRYTVGHDPETGKAIIKNVLGKTQAEVKEKLKTAIEENVGIDYGKAKSFTVGSWLEVWMENYARIKLRPSTFKTSQGFLRNHIKPQIGSIPLAELTSLDLQKFYKHLLEGGRVDRIEAKKKPKGLAPKTVRNIHQMICSAYNLAMEQKLVNKNPTQGCALPKVEHKEMKTLTADQLSAFFREAKETGVYELYYLDLATGLRRGELLGLKWTDMDFNRGVLKIQRAISRQNGRVEVAPLKTKNAYRTLPLSADAIDVLKAQKNKVGSSEWVFPSPTGGPMSPDSVLHMLQRVLKRPAEAGGFQFAALKNDKTRILRPAPFVMDMLRAVRSKQAQRRLQAGDLWQDWIDPAKQYAACRLVFTNALGDHLHPQRLYAHHKKIAAKAGAPDARVHDLRHTFAVLSLQNGDDVKTVQENLGHATAAFTLDVYGHVSERMKEDSAARMQGYFENLKKARKKLRRSHHRRSCFCPR